MLRSIVINNELLRFLAKVINNHVKYGGLVDRGFLSKAIWDFEKGNKSKYDL